VKVIGGLSSTFEHVDLRLSAFQGQPEYKGVFAASGGKKSVRFTTRLFARSSAC